MSQILAMLVAAAVFVYAVAAEAATLRDEAVIHGDRVTLGDLFDDLPADRAATAIARAPQPGRQVSLDAAWLARLARAHGIAWAPADRFVRIVVSRPGHRIDAARIEETLRAALAERSAAERLELRLDGRPAEAWLPIDALPTLAVESLDYDTRSGRFVAALVAPADGPAALRLAVSGRAIGVVTVPVLVRRVRPGEAIAAGDVGLIELSADRLQPDVALQAAELIGMSPRRLVPANEPLRLSDLRPPTLVRRGETVTMLLRTGTLTLTARGRALDEGAAGEVIRVVNTDSNRTIEAEIRAAGTVVVRPGPTLAGLN